MESGKPKVKPTLELYKPPVRRGQQQSHSPKTTTALVTTRDGKKSTTTPPDIAAEKSTDSPVNSSSLYPAPTSCQTENEPAELEISEAANACCYHPRALSPPNFSTNTNVNNPVYLTEEIRREPSSSSSLKIKENDAGVKSFEEILPELKKHLLLPNTAAPEKIICDFLFTNNQQIASSQTRISLSNYIGQFMVKHIVEDCGHHHHKRTNRGLLSRTYAAITASRSSTVAAITAAFCQGTVTALERYFECREELRGGDGNEEEDEYFPIWLNFLATAYELAQVAQQEDRVVQLFFDILAFLFNEPVVHTLKITEVSLESTLSVLLIIGPRLAHERPAQMDELKEWVRSAFLANPESWARKMLLLLMELAANEWRLGPELEEFYFS